MSGCVALLVLVATTAAAAETTTAHVAGVHDGDTITALADDKRKIKVRLPIFNLFPAQHWGTVLQIYL